MPKLDRLLDELKIEKSGHVDYVKANDDELDKCLKQTRELINGFEYTKADHKHRFSLDP